MICFATHDDIDSIMNFINDYWKKNHILARDRNFFEYEMCSDKATNFVIAVNDETGVLDAIEGYIPYGSYSKRYGVCHMEGKQNGRSYVGCKCTEISY